MKKIVGALTLVAVLVGCASAVQAQQKAAGVQPTYIAPGYGYGSPAYGVPVYGAPGYGGGVYVAPGYAPVYPGRVPAFGSSWKPTLGSPASNYYPYGYGAPVYGGSVYYPAPTTVAGGYFRFGNVAGTIGSTYWRSPSGYYYPWAANYIVNSPIIYVQDGQSQPSKPPISTILSDMDKYISEAKEKNRISDQDYVNINRRITDLRRKLSSMMQHADGQLDPQDEESFRRDLEPLSRDIALRVKN